MTKHTSEEEKILVAAAREVAEYKLQIYWLVQRIERLQFFRSDGSVNIANTRFQHHLARQQSEELQKDWRSHNFFMDRPALCHNRIQAYKAVVTRLQNLFENLSRSQRYRPINRVL